MRRRSRQTGSGEWCSSLRRKRGPFRPAHHAAHRSSKGDHAMTTMLRLLIIASLTALMGSAASAHTQSYSFLSLTLGPASADGRLEIAVRDLDRIYDLDADRD